MAKAPAFQFYAGDFLTGTTLMSNAEVGLFIRLLCIQAEHGSIPDDVERIVRAYGEEARQLWAGVQPKFNRGSTKGTLVNERLSIVLAARDAFREKQSIKGKASAASRSSSETKTKHKRFNRGSTVVEPLGDRDIVLVQEEKERAYEAEVEPTFNQWFNIYDKRKAKGECEVKWRTIPQATREAIMAHTRRLVLTTPKEFRKDPIRYLSKQGWEDEIIQRSTNGKHQTDDEYRNEVIRATQERFGNR